MLTQMLKYRYNVDYTEYILATAGQFAAYFFHSLCSIHRFDNVRTASISTPFDTV